MRHIKDQSSWIKVFHTSVRIKRNFSPASAATHRASSQKQDGISASGTDHTGGAATKQVLRCVCSVCEKVCVQRMWESVCAAYVRKCVWVSARKSDCPLSLYLFSSPPLPLSPSPPPLTISSPRGPLIGIMCSSSEGSWESGNISFLKNYPKYIVPRPTGRPLFPSSE